MTGDTKLLYIMGTARSGSTVLEILLAHGEGCLGAGELTAIVEDGFIKNKRCSCGARFYDCEFWGKVAAELGMTRQELVEWARLQHKVEWHTGLLRQCLALLSYQDWTRYYKFNRDFLSVLQEVSGSAVVIDSSKYAGRAVALERMPGVDLSVVCLTRSPEGLMDSFQKPNRDEQIPKRPWAVLRYYIAVLFSLCFARVRLGGRMMAIRYEDLLSDPGGTIAAISEKSGVDLDLVVEKVRNGDEFGVGHIVTGNRLRERKRVRLFRDEDIAVPQKYGFVVPLRIMRAARAMVGRCF